MAGTKKAAAVPLARQSEVEVLEWLITQAEKTYNKATTAESYVAAQSALRQIRELRQELEVKRAASASTGAVSEEQFVSLLKEGVQRIATPHLEIAVSEYLRRHPGLQLVNGKERTP